MKIMSKIFWGAVAAGAYYLYKNKDKLSEKTEEEQVVHFIDLVDEPTEEVTEEVTKENVITEDEVINEENTKPITEKVKPARKPRTKKSPEIE